MLIGYCRVSTADQNHNLQRDALKAAGCSEIFEDTASGARKDRPGLAKALAACNPGDSLVVWKLDRMGRSTQHLLETLQTLKARGIHFRSLTESIDTSTPLGVLFFTLVGAFAEFELGIKRERTLAGLAAARLRGRKGGRKRMISDEKLAAIESMMADPSLTMDQISERVGVKRNTIYATFARMGKPIDRSPDPA